MQERRATMQERRAIMQQERSPMQRVTRSSSAAERSRTRSGDAERGGAAARTHLNKKMISPGSMVKQAFRKQQLRTWKLQQQREQEEEEERRKREEEERRKREEEERRKREEEERRKREEEIRRIRDLSNQDEQYNRFMKLVGGRPRTRSKSRDVEHRKSAGKQGLDSSGNLYQYDNYDEVAMETDSEPPSPASPADEDTGFSQISDCLHFATGFSPLFLPPLLCGLPPLPPPLPPPDEVDPPPKPPLADEEEEEEMLLRETCLMSMAHKRVTATEEKSSSAPPSPGCSSPADLQQPIRSSLSTVSLTRSNKFSRGARAPLVLPRHKAVVVSLRDSEDSDSDSGSQPAFGGLEFMIKEARRTVEAAKPKAASGSEKENNPGRTPEALPEAQRAEYRLLKEQIASREKQKLLKDLGAPPRGPSSPPVPDALQEASVRAAAERRLGEAEQRLSRHRELQQRDEAVLRHLLQQEQKKRESLKAAEGKVLRVREQLQAAEKVVTANRTLLKKLQEQVQRVEQRVSLKQTVCERLQLQLSAAQQAAGGGAKRRADTIHSQPMKQRRLDPALRTAGGHFAELLAQKQRLQLLEREYALKIQQLKDRQALRSNPPVSELPPVSNLTLPTPSPSTLPLSQPSLHDLTQDKLILDSEEEAEDPQVSVSLGEGGPVSASVREGGRRPSLRRSSGSFTRPHLEQQGSPKDNNKPLPLVPPPRTEVLGGLHLEALQQGGGPGGLGELLQREMLLLGGGVHSPSPTAQVVSVEIDAATSQSGRGDLKPVPYTAYHSPLLVFRSYRFSPYFRTKEKLPLSSVTYSNCMDPRRNFCRFELSGTCNDDLCRWQHMRDCTLTGNQLLQDFLSYNLSLIGCSETSSDKDISACTERYMQQLFGSNSVRMSLDQKAVLLVSKVNESRRHGEKLSHS